MPPDASGASKAPPAIPTPGSWPDRVVDGRPASLSADAVYPARPINAMAGVAHAPLDQDT